MGHLPFQGRGLYVPELGSAVGLTADDKGRLHVRVQRQTEPPACTHYEMGSPAVVPSSFTTNS